MFILANLHMDLTFLSSRNEAGNISNLYLSNITLLFSHTASSLFMLRVLFVPFDSYSPGSLSFESVSCFRAAFFPPSDLFTDPSLVRPFSECDRKVIKNKIFIRKSAINTWAG